MQREDGVQSSVRFSEQQRRGPQVPAGGIFSPNGLSDGGPGAATAQSSVAGRDRDISTRQGDGPQATL
ncbi:hypothetical protein IFM12275_15570 [Nocardia sputorum]|nr:hypothetical protein IFM12275_15570 [Nocardia sputorum]